MYVPDVYIYIYIHIPYIYIASFTGAVQCNAVPARPRYENERGDVRWMA